MKIVMRMAVLLCALLCFVAALPAAAASAVTMMIGTATAKPGDTVTIPVILSEVEGLGAVDVHFYYDAAVLECVDALTQGIMNDMDMSTANTEPVEASSEIWLTGMCLKGVTGSGEIMTITFKVKEDAPEGETVVGFTDHAHQLLTADPMEELLFAQISGGITVTTEASAKTSSAAAPSGGVTASTTAAANVGGVQGTVTQPDGQDVPTTGDASGNETTTVVNEAATPSSSSATTQDKAASGGSIGTYAVFVVAAAALIAAAAWMFSRKKAAKSSSENTREAEMVIPTVSDSEDE